MVAGSPRSMLVRPLLVVVLGKVLPDPPIAAADMVAEVYQYTESEPVV